MNEMQKIQELEAIQLQVARASTIADLGAIKRKLGSNGKALEFKVGLVGWAWIIVFMVNLSLIIFNMMNRQPVPLYAIVLFAISAVFVWAVLYCRKVRPNPTQLLNEVEFKACCLKNGVQRIQDTSSIESFLYEEFSEFNRGNYSRGFTEIYQGTYSSEGKAKPYYVYFFNWTDRHEHTETTTDSDGFSRDETHEYFKTYYRNGIVFPVTTPATNIWQRRALERAGRFQVASSLFNTCYNVSGLSEHQLSRFLKPAVVEMILAFTGSLLHLAYESNGKGGLLISTTSNPLMRQETVNTSQALFSQEMPLLKAAIEHAKKLEFQLAVYN